MQYLKGFQNYQNQNRAAVTLGKFDGLHQGHQLLISRVEALSAEEGVDSVVFAFDMSPFFEKKKIPHRMLMSSQEKAEALKDRVDYFIDCPFEETISNMEAKDFIKKVLVDVLHVRYLVIGSDFRFGHNRIGDHELLRQYGTLYDYEVEVIEKKRYQDREISSTYIKEELEKGNYALVDELLGYSYLEHKKTLSSIFENVPK